MYDDNIFQQIYDYIYTGENHERKKIDITRKFNLTKNGYISIMTTLTFKYPIYEDKKILGILVNERSK